MCEYMTESVLHIPCQILKIPGFFGNKTKFIKSDVMWLPPNVAKWLLEVTEVSNVLFVMVLAYILTDYIKHP